MGADVGVVFGGEFPGLLVQGDEAGRIRRGNIDVSPVLTVGRAGVDEVVDDDHGAVGGVVGKHAQFIHHVVDPHDVGVVRPDFGLGSSRSDDVLRLVHKGTVVAVGHALGVEADDLATAG